MSNLLTGALARGAQRIKRRAEAQDENQEAATEDEDMAGEAEGTDGEPDGDEAAPSAEGEETDSGAEDDEGEQSAHGRSADFVAATARCRKILTAASGAKVPSLAAKLAFERLDMSATAAIAVMDAAAEDVGEPSAKGTLGARMAAHKGGVAPAAPKPVAANKGDDALLAAAGLFKRPAKAGK